MFSSPARTRRIWPYPIIAVGLVILGIWLGGHPSWIPASIRGAFVSQTSEERQAQAVLNIIGKDYYRRVNTQKLLNTGLQAAVASLDDPYSHYYPPGDLGAFDTETQGTQDSGIGVDVNQVPKGLELEEVFPRSPAARAGLVQGDVITKVGSTSLAGISIDRASALIRGRAGTKVEITVSAKGHVRRLTLVRANVSVPVAFSTILHYKGAKLGYLGFSQFTNGSAAELRTQVRRVLHEGARGLILDLRDNPGGLLAQAIGVASIFIPSGTIVTTRGRSQPTTVYTAQGDALTTTTPLVVLVNRDTASSAEIVTGALQDRGRAKVVGTHTYGKGVFQELQNTPGGGILDITVGEYFTPNGHNLGARSAADGHTVARGAGITPNVYVYDNPQAPGMKALHVAERVVTAEVR